jgi:transposase-like protein
MATTPTLIELMADEHKRDTRGRHIATPERRAEIVAGYRASGLTQKAYARREGVNYHTLVSWLGQSRHHSARPHRPAAESEPSPAPRFAQLTWPPALPSPPASPAMARLEVVLPDGVTLRGDDPAALVILLRALTSLSPRRPC